MKKLFSCFWSTVELHINNKIKGISLAGWYCIHVRK